VTVYKGLKETDCKPGDWVVISGIGGLGHMAVQYAKAMGYRVIAVDIAAPKLELARKLGAEVTINAAEEDPVEKVQSLGGAQGVLVTAVSNAAFSQGVGMLAPLGTMSLVGLPPGDFDLPIFDVVLHRKTVRGSIVGTRQDLSEALDFAARGLVKAHFTTAKLEDINDIFDQMMKNQIDGRVVMEF
jgi:propanol-preferring alcohol dehydrogenase